MLRSKKDPGCLCCGVAPLVASVLHVECDVTCREKTWLELVHLDKWSSDTVKCTAEDMMSNNTWLDDILIFSKTQASMKFVPRVSKYQLLSDFTALEELVRGGAKVSACWKIGIYVDPSKFKVVRFGKPLRIEIRLNCQKNDITRLKQKSGRSAKIYDGVGDQLWYEKKIGVWLYTSYLTKMCSEGSRFYSQRSAFLVENHERARVVIDPSKIKVVKNWEAPRTSSEVCSFLVAYRLRLPEELKGVHDMFHVSNLKKCLADPTLQIPLDEIQVDAKLNFMEEPIKILEREFKKLKRSRISIVKVRWNSKRGPEFT
ncbi:hypothetical protein Tco_0786912 [Tanacetum coccineum]